MKIVAVEAIPFAVPYRKPLRFASGEVHTADHVLVRVHAEDGVVDTADGLNGPRLRLTRDERRRDRLGAFLGVVAGPVRPGQAQDEPERGIVDVRHGRTHFLVGGAHREAPAAYGRGDERGARHAAVGFVARTAPMNSPA